MTEKTYVDLRQKKLEWIWDGKKLEWMCDGKKIEWIFDGKKPRVDFDGNFFKMGEIKKS